jgi:hypothetical protein
LLLSATPAGACGHFVAVKKHRNNALFVYDSLQHDTVSPLTASYIVNHGPATGNTLTLIMESQRTHQPTSIPDLRITNLADEHESTSTLDYEYLLNRHYERQVAAHCLVHAINNSIGAPVITHEQLQETRRLAETIHILGLRGRTSTAHDMGWFSVTDFNTWAADLRGSGIVLDFLGTHEKGQNFAHSLHEACQRKAEQTKFAWTTRI